MWHNQTQGMIDRVMIIVNGDRILPRTDHCLLEEMTQGLGLPNDIGHDRASIFSNDGIATSLSRSDRIMIRTLYDPRMKPAMPRKIALALARTIIGELNRTMP